MKILLAVVTMLVLSATGCGSDTNQPPDSTASSATDASILEGRTDTATGVPDQAVGPSVAVEYQGTSTTVSLGKTTPVTIDGQSYARLSDLTELGLPAGKRLESLLVDFEASDGFRPAKSGSGSCKPIIPVGGATLSQGYVHLQSRNLRWDDSLGYPGCMAVKDLAKILISDK